LKAKARPLKLRRVRGVVYCAHLVKIMWVGGGEPSAHTPRTHIELQPT
jgi:hypothetical protein